MWDKTLICAFAGVALLFAVAGTTKLAFAAASEIEDFRSDVRQVRVSATALCDAQFRAAHGRPPAIKGGGAAAKEHSRAWGEYRQRCVADLLEHEGAPIIGRLRLLIDRAI